MANYGLEALNSLSEEEMLDLYNRLRFYARFMYGWFRTDFDDIVQEAIVAALSGRRNWTVKDDLPIPPLQFIKGIIRSNISHEFDKKYTEVLLEDNEERGLNEIWDWIITKKSGGWRSPEDAANIEATYHILCRDILHMVSDDSDLTDLVKALIDTPDATLKDLAERLDMSITGTHRALKKLRERILNL